MKATLESVKDSLSALADQFYDNIGCVSGGPLHIVLDDANLESWNILWCLKNIEDGRWDHKTQSEAWAIAERLLYLSPQHRLEWWCEWTDRPLSAYELEEEL